MPSPSQYLGLQIPNDSDQFVTEDIAANWGKIDQAPGRYICTSTTRPTWSDSQTGREIYEKDTHKTYTWGGSSNGWLPDSSSQILVYKTSSTQVSTTVAGAGGLPGVTIVTTPTLSAAQKVGLVGVIKVTATVYLQATSSAARYPIWGAGIVWRGNPASGILVAGYDTVFNDISTSPYVQTAVLSFSYMDRLGDFSTGRDYWTMTTFIPTAAVGGTFTLSALVDSNLIVEGY